VWSSEELKFASDVLAKAGLLTWKATLLDGNGQEQGLRRQKLAAPEPGWEEGSKGSVCSYPLTSLPKAFGYLGSLRAVLRSGERFLH